MYKEKFDIKITNKREVRNWYDAFIKTYQLSFVFINNNKTGIRNVPIEQYDSVVIGDELKITMYSNNKKTWFFSKEEVN